MKKKILLFLSLLVALSVALPASAKPNANFVGQTKGNSAIKHIALPLTHDPNRTLRKGELGNVASSSPTLYAGKTGAVAQKITENFTKLPAENLSTPMSFPEYSECPWLSGSDIYSYDNSAILFGDVNSQINLTNVDATEPIYVRMAVCSQSGYQEGINIILYNGNTPVYAEYLGKGDFPDSGIYWLDLSIPAQSGLTNATLSIETKYNDGVVGVYKLEISAAMTKTTLQPGTPSNILTTVKNDTQFNTTFSGANNATAYQMEVYRSITAKKTLSEFPVWKSNLSEVTGISDDPANPTSLSLCMRNTYVPEMPGTSLHWPVFINGAIGFSAVPNRINHISSYAGFVTDDIDVSGCASDGNVNFYFDVYPYNSNSNEKPNVVIDVNFYNKSTKQYESFANGGLIISGLSYNTWNTDKKVEFPISAVDANTYDLSRFQVTVVTQGSNSLLETLVYFKNMKVTLSKVNSGTVIDCNYIGNESTDTSIDVTTETISGTDDYSCALRYRLRGVYYDSYLNPTYGAWIPDAEPFIPVVVEQGPEEVKAANIKFRDMADENWNATAGAGGAVTVTNDGTNYDNTYLTIWYEAAGFNHSLAWDNKHSGTPRYTMTASQNRAAAGPDDDAAPITDDDLAAAPVHLKVSVELDNGADDNTWKVIDTDKYPDWSWDPADHESLPDDFYRNQIYDYPTAQGYIRIPLMAKNNAVTVTAEANPNYDNGNPTHTGSATMTRTYSFAEGSTTGIEAVETDSNATPRYFNLQGIEVKNPSRGIYIKVVGHKSTKVSIL